MQQKINDACFDEGPVLSEDVLCLRVFQDQEAEQITDRNLAFILRDLSQLTELIDCLPWDAVDVEATLDPLHYVCS